MSAFLSEEYRDLQSVAAKFKDAYKNAEPFPSIYFDNVFDEDKLNEILAEFPDLSKKDTTNYADDVQVKFGSKGEHFFGEKTKAFMHYLNSEPFLNFLQELTGIEETLVNDPYFHGAGQHEIKPGGFLKIHVDFNKHKTLGLDRRINVLVYLNKDWDESYGGHFELWKTDMSECGTKILPLFNRMAIFFTTDKSYHGHPDPLQCPEGMSRKSLALYYNSNGRPADEFAHSQEEHRTLWAQRPEMWIRLNKIGLETAKRLGPEKVMVVQYEDLIADQQALMKKIFDFIGTHEKHSAETAKIARAKMANINTTTKGNSIEKWKKTLTQEEKNELDQCISKHEKEYDAVLTLAQELKVRA